MHTYDKVRDGDGYLYVVRAYMGNTAMGRAIRDFNDENDAIDFVNYLNGGIGVGQMQTLLDRLTDLITMVKRIGSALP